MIYLLYTLLIALITPCYANGMVSIGQKRWHQQFIEKPESVIISIHLAQKFSCDPRLNRYKNKIESPFSDHTYISIHNEVTIPELIQQRIVLKKKWGVSFYAATFYLCALFSGKIFAMQTLFNECNGKLETLLPSNNLELTDDPAFKHGIVFYLKKPISIPRDTSELAMNHFATASPFLKLKLINILI